MNHHFKYFSLLLILHVASTHAFYLYLGILNHKLPQHDQKFRQVSETSYNSGTDQHLLYEEYRNGSLSALKSLIKHELDHDMSVSHVFRRNKLEHLVEISSDIHLKQLQHVFNPEQDNLKVYACRGDDYAGIPPCYEII